MGMIIGVGNTKPTFPYDYYYGIEWDKTVSNPKPSRIGKAELHKSLPLQSMMRRCILKDSGEVNYYLNANDSTKRDNGAVADLTGGHGQYMVEVPDMYVRFETDGNKCRHLQSTQPLPGFVKWRKDYVSAVEATVERATQKLSAVVNTTPEYRGGGNQASWDELSKSQLGKPATSISLTNFRAYARKRGTTEWNCNLYQTHKKLWWLFAVEYANFNSQDTFNAALDENGCRQGGLGAGVTTLNGTKWSNFNGYNPVIPCGITNSLGNKTGVVDYTMPTEYDEAKFIVSVPSYRGVENPFGHLWKWTDGCKCLIQSEANGGLSEFYVCDDPAAFQSSGVAGYELRGNLPRKDGYVKAMVLGEYGEIMPLEVGGGSTTYFCDYFYTNIPSSGVAERGVLFGGSAVGGASAGFVYAYTNSTSSFAYAYFGSRLCFFPQIE
ncbi:hypothetical protein [Prevotella sp.]|uniref:hypothetical protein n=1 Tax=Prevotella sp. TaxID=59823 RepID=UPI002F951130